MSDTKSYPEGSGATKGRYITDSVRGTAPTLVEFGVIKTSRQRLTVAQLNAAAPLRAYELLPALAGVRWRLIDWAMIAIGGAATTATSVNIIGTVAASAVQLAVTAVAALTRSALVRAGAANAVILADGASFTQMDVNTAITCITVGAAMTVLTSLDVILDYVADPA